MTTLDGNSRAIMLCTFRSCDWQSADVRTMTVGEQDAVARWHLIDEHPELLAALAKVAAAPTGVCARPHPTVPGRWCLDPRGHTGSHGDGRTDRWVLR